MRDARVMWEFGVDAVAVITAVTAQNETGFLGWEPVDPGIIRHQVVSVTRTPCRWVKIGMTGGMENFEALMAIIRQRCPKAFVVLDPVLRASTGASLNCL